MKKLFAAIGLDVFRNQQDILYTCMYFGFQSFKSFRSDEHR